MSDRHTVAVLLIYGAGVRLLTRTSQTRFGGSDQFTNRSASAHRLLCASREI
jgi:hypothetical protein